MAQTMRERLLAWIRDPDTTRVPIILGPGPEVAASCLGKDARDVTWADAVRVAADTGIHNIACIHTAQNLSDWPFGFADDVQVTRHDETYPNGDSRVTTRFAIPEGVLTCSQVNSSTTGLYPGESLVKNEDDLILVRGLLERTRKAVIRPWVSEAVADALELTTHQVSGAFPTLVGMTPPAMTLLINPYTDKETGLMMLHDQPELLEELMECLWQIEEVFLGAAAKCGVDIYRVAVNGFEWLSPSLYEKYMIPQVRRVAGFAADRGALSWVHTCGKLKDIARSGTYDRMGVDVVESLSTPPTGDIDNVAETRRDIGGRIVTRGGINVELFYREDTSDLRDQVAYVLDSVAGYKHIIGDTNPPHPPYPWRSIEALVDAAESRRTITV